MASEIGPVTLTVTDGVKQQIVGTRGAPTPSVVRPVSRGQRRQQAELPAMLCT